MTLGRQLWLIRATLRTHTGGQRMNAGKNGKKKPPLRASASCPAENRLTRRWEGRRTVSQPEQQQQRHRLDCRTTQNQIKSSFLLWVDCSAQVGQLIVFYSETIARNLSDERQRQQISLLIVSSGKKSGKRDPRSDCSTCEKSVRRSLWPGISRCFEKN